MTGCQGELANEDFVFVIRDEDGQEILNDKIKSPDNGFVDLWLPRDKNLHVKIEYDGKVAEQEISTFQGADTCITTMQLQ